MPDRTSEQILDQTTYAAACVARHYGPGLSEIGLIDLRTILNQLDWKTDSCYRIDVYEGDQFVDFDQRIIWPADWTPLPFEEVNPHSVCRKVDLKLQAKRAILKRIIDECEVELNAVESGAISYDAASFARRVKTLVEET